MAQQIASMFASLGFKVDKTGLTEFSLALRKAREDTVKWGRSTGILSKRIRSLRDAVKGLNTALGQTQIGKANRNLNETYRLLAINVNKVNKNLRGLVYIRKDVTNAIGKINSSVIAGVPHWERYANAIRRSRLELTRLSNRSRVPPIPPNPSNRNRSNGNGGAGGGSGFGRNGRGGRGNSVGEGLQDLASNFLPTQLLGRGGAIGAVGLAIGYAGKKTVDAGRDVNKMRIVLQMASKDAEDLAHNFEFVKKTSQEMGIDVVEFGQAYAKMLSATRDNSILSNKDKEMMFSNLSKYMVTIGASTDDQKGIFRALTQMFTKGKVQAEEMLQMAERGVPAAIEIKRAAIEGLKMTEEQFNKAQQKGQLDPTKLLPIMSENLAKLATQTGAYDKATNSSVASQQRFYNNLKLLADVIYQGGVDQALSDVFNFLNNITLSLQDSVRGFKALVSILKDTFSALKKVNDQWSKSYDSIRSVLGLEKQHNDILTKNIQATHDASEKASTYTKTMNVLRKALEYILFPIKAVSDGLKSISETMEKSNNGQWTWIDDWLFHIEYWGMKTSLIFDKTVLSIRNAWRWLRNPTAKTVRSEFFGLSWGKGNGNIPNGIASPDIVRKQNQTQQNNVNSIIGNLPSQKITLPPKPLTETMPKTTEDMLKMFSNNFKIDVHVDGTTLNPSYITTSLTG